jgi:SAM-dependent methyltransferase
MLKHSSPVSFRDPEARLYVSDGRVLRFLHASAAGPIIAFIQSPAAASLVSAGHLVSSVQRTASDLQTDAEVPGEWLEHERIWFPSFPFEWAPEMLYEAGLLTLTVTETAMRAGFELKDATPFNVLFKGSQPVFIDVASFQRFDSAVITWHAYAQFVESFILPLLVYRLSGLRVDWVFAHSRDGLHPSELRNFPGLWRSSAGRRYVLLPRLFESRQPHPPSAKTTRQRDTEVARFVRERLYRSLRRSLRSLYPPDPPGTDVVEYAASRSNQEAEQTHIKRQTVEEWLRRINPRRVLDVGANTGEYSLLAASLGASVVSIDKAPEAISALYRRSFAARADVQPLLVDLMRPTPAIGWNNAEHPSFLDRARSQFDAVLFLAVIHHVVINDRVPLEDLFRLLADLTTSWLIAEFVSREDSNFVLVSRGRDSLFSSHTEQAFESAATQHFRIEARLVLPGQTRILYFLRKES